MKEKPVRLWVVGKFISPKAWELQGVFDEESLAVANCKSDRYFVGPVKLNQTLPERAVPWPGAYYPLGNA